MDNKINGKTPEEIKKGLECCLAAREYRNCLTCPYGTPKKRGVAPCDCEVKQDVFAYIQQLERERDALLDVIRGDCCICANYKECVENDFTIERNYPSCWQWRGEQEET